MILLQHVDNMIMRGYTRMHARTHAHSPVVYTAARRTWVTSQSAAVAADSLRESTG